MSLKDKIKDLKIGLLMNKLGSVKYPIIRGLQKLSLLLLCLLFGLPAFAQNEGMATGLRESGKIYVVVGVVVLIFIGLLIYLIRVDRKLQQIEEAQKEKSSEQ